MAKKINEKKTHDPQVGYDFDRQAIIVSAKPFIKWAGGKSALLPTLIKFFPPRISIRNYYEPFLGGGAVFFALQPPRAILCDSNRDLIELYQLVRDDVENLIGRLKLFYNDKDFYYRVREQDPSASSPLARAARFIFLNKTCYNGLYRVNSKGKFNVPFGRYTNPLICDAEGLRASSLALKNATLLNTDFEKAIEDAEAGDFIYFDPPYYPLNSTSSFTSYTSAGFGESEQIRLARVVKDLTVRGVNVMVSNSDSGTIRELYSGFRINEILASRAINCKANGRGKIPELVITNY